MQAHLIPVKKGNIGRMTAVAVVSWILLFSQQPPSVGAFSPLWQSQRRVHQQRLSLLVNDASFVTRHQSRIQSPFHGIILKDRNDGFADATNQADSSFRNETSSSAVNGASVATQVQDSNNNNDKNSYTETNSSLFSSLLAVDPQDIEIVTIDQPPRDTSMTDDSSTNNKEQQNLLSRLPFVSMFRGSANYIANHRNTLAVYHIPGALLDLPNPNDFRDLMNDVAITWLLGMKVVLVVGCRHQVEKRIQDPERFHGLRVTDEETLRVVKEEAGYVRFEVERQLARSLRMQGSGSSDVLPSSRFDSPNRERQGASVPSGYYDGNVVSGNFYSAQPFGILDGVDYKYTGFVRRIEVEKIRRLHESKDICLMTTLGVSPSGEVFNVNSESLAAAAAGALKASKVVFFTEQEMELRHERGGTKIQSLRMSDGRNLLKHADFNVHKKGYVTLGPGVPEDFDRPALSMLLKIGYSIQALEQGVKRAHIISPKHGSLLQELYTRDGSGTLVSGDLYEGIREATVDDVAGIHDLISPLIKMGTLIDRPRAQLERDISKYHVYTRDNHIVACGQLKVFEEGFAEIGCLVVNKDYRARGRGDAMLGYLERLCLMKGCPTVFVLSTQTMEWFVERGFEEVGVDKLPASRPYNHERKSKIYMKKIESVRDLDASELWWNR